MPHWEHAPEGSRTTVETRYQPGSDVLSVVRTAKELSLSLQAGGSSSPGTGTASPSKATISLPEATKEPVGCGADLFLRHSGLPEIVE